ncbi:protein BRANCHLESS TRICHOME-like [Musa acuminata AAA Group]|uniref:protein BRANCHLESS TRICHOME-like n=1 Tax=Musa acuminata AAA Group TaxID=214697 RepID=UPI0031CEBEC0
MCSSFLPLSLLQKGIATLLTCESQDNTHTHTRDLICCDDCPQHHRVYNWTRSEALLLPRNLSMDCHGTRSEVELAHARIEELKAELEQERRMRCKAESTSKALARELAEERRAREAAEGLRRRLEEELASRQEEVERVTREIEEERRMLQIAELWREERVQIKLLEAKLVMEEKLQQMTTTTTMTTTAAGQGKREGENKGGDQSQSGQHGQQRREVENPHIRRGIKGFVEFPKVGRTQRPAKEGRVALGESNLECQRAQLRILLRQRNHGGLVGTSLHFVT